MESNKSEEEQEQLCQKDRLALQSTGRHSAPSVREVVWVAVEPHQQAPVQVDGPVPQTVFVAYRQRGGPRPQALLDTRGGRNSCQVGGHVRVKKLEEGERGTAKSYPQAMSRALGQHFEPIDHKEKVDERGGQGYPTSLLPAWTTLVSDCQVYAWPQ